MGSLITFDALFVGGAVIFSVLLGVIVFLNDRHASINRAFLVYAFSISAWSIANYFTYQPFLSENATLWVIRVVMALATIQAAAFYCIARFQTLGENGWSKLKRKLFFGITALIICLTLSPFVFSSLAHDIYGVLSTPLKTNAGFGIILFAIFAGSTIFGGLLLLAKASFNHDGIKVKQARILLAGGALTYLPILLLNFIFPAFLQNARFVPIGVVLTIPFLLLTTYGIVRYHLFQINIAVTHVAILSLMVLVYTLLSVAGGNAQRLRLALLLGLLLTGIILVIGLYRDLAQTDRLRKIAKQFANLNEQANKLDRVKADFVSMTSHQLQSPLTIIQGHLSLLRAGMVDAASKSGKQSLDTIAKATERLIGLVGEILNLARVDSAKLTYHFVSTDLYELTKETIKQNEVRAKQKNIKIQLEGDSAKDYRLLIDPVKISEVIDNYVDNAIKYSRPYSSILVKIEQQQNSVRLSVKDGGIGMTKDELKNTFTKFYRSSSAQQIDKNGMGIGLYVVARIIETHKGAFGALSDGTGKGSTFYFKIPRIVAVR